MALTRKFLKGMGLSDEQIDSIIESHTDTVNGLKEQIDDLKDSANNSGQKKGKSEPAGKNAGTGKNAGAQGSEEENPWEKKYNDLQKEMDELKAKQAAKETHDKKESAFRKLLEDIGVSEKRRNSVVKVSDIDALEIDDKGAIKDADKLKASLQTEWADFIEQRQMQGSNTATPPAGGDAGGKAANPKAAEIAARYYSNLYGTPAPQMSSGNSDPTPTKKE